MINMIDVLCDDDVMPLLADDLVCEAVLLSSAVVQAVGKPSLCLRFASDKVVRALNAQWRDKDCVTDVLSFSMQDIDDWDGASSLGDIVLAVPFIEQEAGRLQRSAPDHAMHLIVHGTLHLFGFDHVKDGEAEVMQRFENQIMLKLGLHAPYPELLDEVNE